jgi:hypothetical protein
MLIVGEFLSVSLALAFLSRVDAGKPTLSPDEVHELTSF